MNILLGSPVIFHSLAFLLLIVSVILCCTFIFELLFIFVNIVNSSTAIFKFLNLVSHFYLFFVRPEGTLNPHLEESSSESLENVRFLFDSEDLLDCAVSINQRDLSNNEKDLMLGLIKMNMATPSLETLIKRCNIILLYFILF